MAASQRARKFLGDVAGGLNEAAENDWVVAITDDSAAIKAVSGGSLTFRRRAVAEAERCLIWELQR